MVQRNKPRLYVALCSRGDNSFRDEVKCESYHWVILVGPDSPYKAEAGVRYQVRHEAGHKQWYYEEQDVEASASEKVMVRIAIAKVVSTARLEKILRSLPLPEDDPSYSCLTWVKTGFRKLINDSSAIKGYVNADDWVDIESRARRYAQQKRGQRRFQEGTGDKTTVPTWNFWENREIYS